MPLLPSEDKFFPNAQKAPQGSSMAPREEIASLFSDLGRKDGGDVLATKDQLLLGIAPLSFRFVHIRANTVVL